MRLLTTPLVLLLSCSVAREQVLEIPTLEIVLGGGDLRLASIATSLTHQEAAIIDGDELLVAVVGSTSNVACSAGLHFALVSEHRACFGSGRIPPESAHFALYIPLSECTREPSPFRVARVPTPGAQLSLGSCHAPAELYEPPASVRIDGVRVIRAPAA